jgi:hypothetical protein
MQKFYHFKIPDEAQEEKDAKRNLHVNMGAILNF